VNTGRYSPPNIQSHTAPPDLHLVGFRDHSVWRENGAWYQLIVDRTQSSLDPATDHNLHVAPLMLGPDEPLRLRIFLDRSILEVFANERVSITSRIYPTRTDSVGVALLAGRGEDQLLGLDAWQIR
jgi:beta-fructofuranosidase